MNNSRFGGRPRVPREQVRDQRVVTFLTAEERERLQKVADDAGVYVSRACHSLVMKALRRTDPMGKNNNAPQRRQK